MYIVLCNYVFNIICNTSIITQLCGRNLSTYLFGGEMAERVVVSYKPKKKSNLLHVYSFNVSSRSARFTLYNELTKCRAEHEWLRKLPITYGRAAITDAITACGRVIHDNSDRTPYRGNKNRIVLGAVSPPSRRGTHVLYLSGFGEVETKQKVDESWDMRSFRLVDVTHRITRRTQPKDHVFELHISVYITPPNLPKTGNMRGIDVGGKHLAVTADFKDDTTIYDMPHKEVLREIDALKSIRDRHAKGKHRWKKLNCTIRQKYKKANGLATNAINQAVNDICTGVDVIGGEDIKPKDMPRRGGNRKRNINRPMRENRVGEFKRKIRQKSEERNIELEDVSPKYTSQTCSVCGYVDSKSRVTRGRFICTNCGQELHADKNAARNILYGAAGKVVQRRLWHGGNKPTLRRPLYKAPRKGISNVYYCI